MNSLSKQLLRVAKKKGLKTWHEVRVYAYPFKKYNNITLRDLDRIAIKLK